MASEAGIGVANIVLTFVINVLVLLCIKPLWPRGIGLPCFVTGRPDGTLRTSPRHFLAWDQIDPAGLTQSWLLPEWGLVAFRCSMVLTWLGTMVLHAVTGGGFTYGYADPPGTWIIFFTNITWVGFCVAFCAGLYNHLMKDLQPPPPGPAGEKVFIQHDGPTIDGIETGAGPVDLPPAEDAQACAPPPVWAWYQKAFILIWVVILTSSLMLDVFYWAVIYDGGAEYWEVAGAAKEFTNAMRHAVNTALLWIDLFLSKVPIATYHYQPVLWYTTAYAVWMWIYYGASGDWIYESLGWDRASSPAYVILLVVLLAISLFINFGLVLLRDKLSHAYHTHRGTL
ncbi:unnamed protein product [Pedinophyceae sp. YPF-701]|nr:unnamed protein product [Pedinophyceae sp. YPF-701]